MEHTVNIHIVREKESYSFYVLLLLIPAMVFVFVLTIIFTSVPTKFAATSQDVKILGEQTQNQP